MKKTIIIISLIIISATQMFAEASPYLVELSRRFTKEIFDMNGTAYLNPLVKSLNATANSRFFSSAYIPKKSEKIYFKFSVQSMGGIVPQNQKTFNPSFPMAKTDLSAGSEIWNYLTPEYSIKDTAGLIYYAFKTLIYQGVSSGSLTLPGETATILGKDSKVFYLPNDVLQELVKTNPAYVILAMASPVMSDSIMNLVKKFPWYFTFPPGANMNTLFAAVPQIEIGGLYGSELLIRLIPPINYGKNIGDFAFWGVGVKHSISQYFYDNDEDAQKGVNIAFQASYQGTYLHNTVGVTNAEFHAYGTFFNLSVQASQNVFDFCDVFTGFSYEKASIRADYKYYLPVEMQMEIGLMATDTAKNSGYVDVANGYPGDNSPQTSNIKINDNGFKWVLGISKPIGDFDIILDYSLGKFSMFGLAIQYRL